MEIYLVGGAVRDSLLGKAIKERDWVVVGATVAELVALGYKKVGRDFPVFLHPVTHEEYALARIERKTGKGYTQFSFYTDPSVTLIEDLRRRDLTINAMARSMHGELIDPYGGEADLRNKVLRHVSPAFVEDPVRVLRVARFAAKFGDFVVHPSTMQMMRVVLLAGELDALVPERVWREWRLSLLEQNPEKFYSVLEGCGALAKLFPEFAKNFVLVSRVLKQVVCVSDDPLIRFAAVMGCLTEEEVLAVCKRYRVPKEYTQLGRLVARHRDFYQHILHTVHCSITDFRDGSRQSNKAVSQSTVTEIDSSSLVLQQGVSAVNKRSLLGINEHCEQGHNEAASQNTVTEIDSSSLVLQQGVSAVNKRSLLGINEHCEQGHNEAASQNTVTEIDSSSLVLQQGVSAVNKRSLLDINEHCEQGHNEAASQNTKSIGEVLLWLNSIDAYRRPQRLQQLLVTCEVVAQCIEMEDVTNDTIMISPRIKFLQRIYEAARGVNIKDLVDTGLQGEELREKIQELRLLAVRRLMS